MTEPIQEKVFKDDPISGRDQFLQPACDSLPDPHKVENGGTFRPGETGPNIGRSLAQILIVLVVLLVLVNIPFNNASAGLAQLMPQSTSIVIRDGLLLKGSGPELYVVDNYKLRHVSPEAFEEFFGHSRRINTVEDRLLAQFGQGSPVYRLLKCRTKPEIYIVEDGLKRQVNELSTNRDQAWDKVGLVACSHLEGIPDGPAYP